MLKEIKAVADLYDALFDLRTAEGGECAEEEYIMGLFTEVAKEAIETLKVCVEGLETGGVKRLSKAFKQLEAATYNE